MMLRVENRRLLPKRPVDAQGDDVALPIGHRVGKGLEKPRRYVMASDRLLVRQRAELELYSTWQVIKACRLVRWVVKQQVWRTAGRIGCVLEPGPALRFAKNIFCIGLESRRSWPGSSRNESLMSGPPRVHGRSGASTWAPAGDHREASAVPQQGAFASDGHAVRASRDHGQVREMPESEDR